MTTLTQAQAGPAPFDLQGELARVRGALQKGQIEVATRICRSILDRHTDLPAAWCMLGLSALQGGDGETAVEAFETAVALRPALAENRILLGRAYVMAGRLEEARASYLEADRLSPDQAEVLLQLGRIETDLGNQAAGLEFSKRGLKLAGQQSMRVLRRKLADPLVPVLTWAKRPWRLGSALSTDVMIARAKLAERMNQDALAVSLLEQVIEADPANAEAAADLARRQNDLRDGPTAIRICEKALADGASSTALSFEYSRALLRAGRPFEADAAIRPVVAERPRDPVTLRIHAEIMAETGDHDGRREALVKALDLDPNFLPALFDLARWHLDTGDKKAAEPILRMIVEQDPYFGHAWHSLARIGMLKADEPAFGRLLAAIEDRKGTQLQRAALNFAAAGVLERAGNKDAAFGHLRAANALVDVTFSPDAFDALVDELIRVFDKAFFEDAKRQGLGNPTEAPVFVVGMPRSGTSLTEQILASHDDVFGAGELDKIAAIAGRLAGADAAGRDYPAGVQGLDHTEVAALAEEYLEELRQRAGGDARRMVDKMPGNFLFLGLIALMFPRARIVHCHRDPMDTCLSIYGQLFNGLHPYAYDLENLGRYYRAYQRLMDHWHRVLPNEILDFSYEAVIDDQRGATEALLAHCGLDWDEACMAFYQNKRAVHTNSNIQVSQPLYRDAMRKWKAYEAHLAPLAAVLEGSNG